MAQEMVISNEPRQGSKASNGAMLNASDPLMEIPHIDIGLLASPSNSIEELEELRSALCSCSCFQAINHGMTTDLDKMRELTKQFFALPLEEKKKYKEANCIEGYGNDLIGKHPESNRGDRSYLFLRSIPQELHKLNLWPENPQGFRETFQEYSRKMHLLSEVLLKAMARSLDLQENCFLNQLGEQRITGARFNFYPPCPNPDEPILGHKPHSDLSAITLLLQDKDVEVLQFLKGNQWVRAPIVPHALLIMVGDQLEIMSNGVFKSPVRRVVTNPDRSRISVAGFTIPTPEMEIEPARGLIDETRPRLYKKVNNYFDLYIASYAKGERYIEEMKI